ncbi:hypothetical protein EIP86_006483 [Pleurotus ostreatoroseus]|nr:hypothetical protein EIP86_006483 [Pleurotus ostreatoroseus]
MLAPYPINLRPSTRKPRALTPLDTGTASAPASSPTSPTTSAPPSSVPASASGSAAHLPLDPADPHNPDRDPPSSPPSPASKRRKPKRGLFALRRPSSSSGSAHAGDLRRALTPVAPPMDDGARVGGSRSAPGHAGPAAAESTSGPSVSSGASATAEQGPPPVQRARSASAASQTQAPRLGPIFSASADLVHALARKKSLPASASGKARRRTEPVPLSSAASSARVSFEHGYERGHEGVYEYEYAHGEHRHERGRGGEYGYGHGHGQEYEHEYAVDMHTDTDAGTGTGTDARRPSTSTSTRDTGTQDSAHQLHPQGHAQGRVEFAHAADVPYPCSYERRVVDNDVWEGRWVRAVCGDVSFHDFGGGGDGGESECEEESGREGEDKTGSGDEGGREHGVNGRAPRKVLDIGCGLIVHWDTDVRIDTGTDDSTSHRHGRVGAGVRDALAGLDIAPLQADLSRHLPDAGPGGEHAHAHPLGHGLAARVRWVRANLHVKRIARGVPEDKLLEEELTFPGKPVDKDTDADADADMHLAHTASTAPSPWSSASVLSLPVAPTPSLPSASAAKFNSNSNSNSKYTPTSASASASSASTSSASNSSLAIPMPIPVPIPRPPPRKRTHGYSFAAAGAMVPVGLAVPPPVVARPPVVAVPTPLPAAAPAHGRLQACAQNQAHDHAEDEHERDERERERHAPEAPRDPRDHALLEYIYVEMHAARFVNLEPLALLANSLGLYFTGECCSGLGSRFEF